MTKVERPEFENYQYMISQYSSTNPKLKDFVVKNNSRTFYYTHMEFWIHNQSILKACTPTILLEKFNKLSLTSALKLAFPKPHKTISWENVSKDCSLAK